MFDFSYETNKDDTITGRLGLGGIYLVSVIVPVWYTKENIEKRLKRKLAERLGKAFAITDLFK